MQLEQLSDPKVLLIDDVEAEISDIQKALNKLNIITEFVNASPNEIKKRENQLESVELIFLDLYFNTRFNAQIDPETCVQIIKQAIKEGKEYYLVIWSKDADEAGEVLDLLEHYGVSPIKSIIRRKSDYEIGKHKYDVERLFEELDQEFSNVTVNIEEIDGQILDIQEDCVIIDCLLDKQTEIIQKRRFDILPFTNIKNLKEGNFITIKIITKPGSKLYEFYNNNSKHISKLFNKDHFFDGIDENSFK